MKAAVYAGTKNVYQDMIPSMKSLLIHSDVDKIYFLIEDDQFPYQLPPEVECINVSGQEWFPKDGPNYNARCSCMVLLRAAFTKLFPNLDKILSIDNDIIINENISNLWDIDLENNYFAGVVEPRKSNEDFKYINFGFIMYNLKQLREDKMDDVIINDLNTYFLPQAEQDCFNTHCQNRFLELPSTYNCNWYTLKTNNANQAKVRHYAFTSKWQELPIIQKYRDIEIVRNIPDNYNLDIVIPYYNCFEGLKHTLNSVYHNSLLSNITITVVDDASPVPCDSLEEVYPQVNFIHLKENHGPGNARQVGVDNTHSPYVMFIDAGDVIFTKVNLITVLQTIKEHGSCHLIQFKWQDQFSKGIFAKDNWCIHGTIFNRAFLDMYNIRFPVTPDCAYCSDDMAFMKSCQLVEAQILQTERLTNFYEGSDLIYLRTYDGTSITNNNPCKKIIASLANNAYYVVDKARKNDVSPYIISNFVTDIMMGIFENYMACAKEAPELLEYNFEIAKKYYNKLFKTYEKINKKTLQEYYHGRLRKLMTLTSDIFPNVNLNQFLESLRK